MKRSASGQFDDRLGVIETKTIEIVDGQLLKNMGIKRMHGKLFKESRDADEALKSLLIHKLEHSNAVDCRHGRQCPSSIPAIPVRGEIACQGCHYPADGTSKWMKMQEPFAKSTRICMIITEETGEWQVKRQPLSISVHPNAKVNHEHLKASKDTMRNKPSAETDAMETDSFEENNFGKSLHTSECATRSPKACIAEAHLASQMDASNAHTSEMDKLLTHIEPPEPNPEVGMGNCLNAGPDDRWIKRLKVSSSNADRITRSSSMAKKVPHDKVNSSNPRKLSFRLQVVPDLGGDSLKKDNIWIRRWLCNRSILTETKPETVLVPKTSCSRFTPGNPQKEQFPNAAAMALTGKAMTGIRQCNIHKKGSFTIWQTKTP